MDARRLVERIWFGDGLVATATRIALSPLARVYERVVGVRARMYDGGALQVTAPELPAISVGNLTVGGTGKTPVAAWLAAQLAAHAHPAIVLRGYGDDEIHVHRRLNPTIPVIADADRLSGIRRAASNGADVAVLDDAFQHRRVARTADVVLVSVEQVLRPRRLLPAGPWREPLAAARRADLLVLTRKSASAREAAAALETVSHDAPGVPVAIVHLAPHELVAASGGDTRPLDLRNHRVVAIAAIGEPRTFERQLEQAGAEVTLHAFPDHHAFSDAEVAALAASVPTDALAVCTLKDAVKLGERWPGPSRLWYVSQQLLVEQGQEDLDRLLQRVLDARASTSSAAG